MRALSLFTLASLGLAVAACGNGNSSSHSADAASNSAAANDSVAGGPAAPPAAPAAAPESAPQSGPPAAPTAAPQAGGVTLAALTGDAAKGERVFAQCKACHVAEPGVNRVGPSLYGVVGRKAGSVPGFSYSNANRNSGFTWTPEQLFTYLEAPQRVLPGTRMAFGGLKNPQDRADVIAYLQTKA